MDGENRAGSSFCLWCLCGSRSCHSRLLDRVSVKIAGRCEKNASHSKKIKNRRATIEIIDPIDEIRFHDI